MDTKMCTEEDLRAMKYVDLQKITKDRGLTSSGKRIKAAVLIEMILEDQKKDEVDPEQDPKSRSKSEQETKPVQDPEPETVSELKPEENSETKPEQESETKPEPDMTDDVAAVVAALDSANQETSTTDSHKEDVTDSMEKLELLDDIEFPDTTGLTSPEDDLPKETKVTTRKRGRAGKEIPVVDNVLSSVPKIDKSVAASQETETRQSKGSSLQASDGAESNAQDNSRKRRRTRTFDKDEEDKNKPVEKDAKVSAKQNRISKSQEEAPKTVKRARTTTFDKEKPVPVAPELAAGQQMGATCQTISDKVSSAAVEQQKPGKIITPSKATLKARRSLAITPAATPPIIHKVQRMIRKSIGSPKVDAKSATKPPGGAKIMKPVFTVGRGDMPAKKDGKATVTKREGSNIPRFVSYARKIKVPNFAKIHEKASKRMESLDDYIKRTHTSERSIQKPKVNPENVFKPEVTSAKNLNFDFTSAAKSPARLIKTPNAAPKPGKKTTPKTDTKAASKTELSKKSPKGAINSSAKKQPLVGKSPKSVKTFSNAAASVRKSVTKLPPAQKSPTSAKRFSFAAASVRKSVTKLPPALKSPRTTQKLPKVQEHKESMPAQKQAVTDSRPSALPRLFKENVKPTKPSASPAVPKVVSAKPAPTPGSSKKNNELDTSIATKPVGYVPYKGAVRPLANRETLKNMAHRNPNLKTRDEIRAGQKQMLKGVRLNKRFELQMAKRGINM